MGWLSSRRGAGDFDAVLSAARESYRAFFVRRIAELRLGGKECVVELLVQPNGRVSPHPFNLIRLDVMMGRADDPRLERLVDGAVRATREEEFTLPGGLRVTASSVGWEEFVVSFSSPDFEIDALSDWLGRWMDVDETHAVDEHGLSGVVHGLAWEAQGYRWLVNADLGSAPVDAARELLGVLSASGVARCEILPPHPGDA
jgi:hypothetical protein